MFGADVNYIDESGHSCIWLSTNSVNCNIEFIQELINHNIEKTINLNCQDIFKKISIDFERTPLENAIKNKNYKVVKLLLENGANPNLITLFNTKIAQIATYLAKARL